MKKSGLLESSAEEGARALALGFLEQARDAASRLADDGDVEALHDFRVGLRRLRSCLRAYDAILRPATTRTERARLRKLARRTGPGRDAEVQLQWLREEERAASVQEQPGVRWLEQKLEERVTKAYEHVRRAILERFEKLYRKLHGSLGAYDVRVRVGEPDPGPSFAEITLAAVRKQRQALEQDVARVASLEDEAQAHQARIHCKRLRYLLEPLRDELGPAALAVESLRTLQDRLGVLNDLHVLASAVGQALEDAALERARQLREAALETGPDPVDAVLLADERPGLLALLTRIQADRTSFFEQIRSEWLGDGPSMSALRSQAAAVEHALEEHAKAPTTEIERKYLLSALPPRCAEAPHLELEQGYIPGEKLHERLRRTRSEQGERYERTVKLGRGVVRIEVEEETSAEVFARLWELTEGKRIRKIRYLVADADRTWEIDAFLDRELWLAEIELPSEDAAVVIPEWLAPHVVREVTDEDAYVNLNLAK